MNMKQTLVAGLAAALAMAAPFSGTQAAAPEPAATASVKLPHRIMRLENGLTLVLMPDDTIPNVGVELWIRGGSREERPGQFGIAHLFEHQLSAAGGSRLYANPANRALVRSTVRATGAGTDPDYVNIYRTVAPEGLEVTLAALAGQLGSAGHSFTAARLKTDKDVVVSELRRDTDLAWNVEVYARLQRGTFGANHPYGHSTSGSEGDVRAATVSLMQDWLRRFGGARSAVLFIVGNFDPAAAEQMARRHFGPLAAGESPPRLRLPVPRPMAGRDIIQTNFPVGAVFMQWPTPGWGTRDGDRLILLSRILERRLNRGGSGAVKATATAQQWELAGAFALTDEAASPAAANEAEARLSAALRDLLDKGPSSEELEIAKAEWKTDFLLSLQNPVWRGSRADAVGRGLLFHGDPDRYRLQISRISSSTAQEVRAAGMKWLRQPGYVLHALPQEREVPTAAAAVEPGPTIAPSAFREPRAPAVEAKRLRNGGKLVVATRSDLPLARVTLAFPAGTASDEPRSAGRAGAVLAALPNAKLSTGISLAEGLGQLGAKLETKIDGDFASLSFTILREQLEPGLKIALEAVANGPTEGVFTEALQSRRSAAAAASTNPSEARWSVAACALMDPCNPTLMAGSGSEETLGALSTDALRSFYKGRYSGTSALVIVSGAAESARLASLVEAALPAGPAAPRDVAWQPRTSAPKVSVIDAPGAAQASLLLVQPLPAGLAADPAPAELTTLTFRQRLMDILRTEKGWSYEMYPYGNRVGRSGSFLHMNIPIQTDKVALGIKEVEAEAARLRTAPVSAGFLATSKGYLQGGLQSALTSLPAMNEQLLEAERGGLSPEYYSRFLRGLPEVSPEQVRALAETMLVPEQFVWAVAGDAKRIGAALDAEKIPYVVVQPVR